MVSKDKNRCIIHTGIIKKNSFSIFLSAKKFLEQDKQDN